MKDRIESLDWLRGIAALSIMLYHLGGNSNSATILGKLGIYGVSIFFILSGLSMAMAYHSYIKSIRTAGTFFIRRLFRILPLLWLAIACVAVPSYLYGNPISTSKIFLNVTTLFGFVAPYEYINMGAWSIGNEMVYYALTPFFLVAYSRRRWMGNILTLLSVTIGMYFAFYYLDSTILLEHQWARYINPFNNLFLYSAGLALFYNLNDVEVPPIWRLPILLFSIAALIFYPSSGDQICIVTGIHRIGLTLISLLIVFSFYKCAPVLPKFLGDRLEQLGVATYGVYLLHPIVIEWTRKPLQAVGVHSPYLLLTFFVVLTIIISLLLFKYFEAPLIKIGKRFTQQHDKSEKYDDSAAQRK